MRARDSKFISVRLRLSENARIGPGKIALLEAIDKHGSLTAAAAGMTMSPSRAWLLMDSLNQASDQLVVEKQDEDHAQLTDLGRQIVAAFRAVESETRKSAAHHFAGLMPDDRGL